MRLKVGAFARRRSAIKALSVDSRGFGGSFCRQGTLINLVR